jgi:hypothetical protein
MVMVSTNKGLAIPLSPTHIDSVIAFYFHTQTKSIRLVLIAKGITVKFYYRIALHIVNITTMDQLTIKTPNLNVVI